MLSFIHQATRQTKDVSEDVNINRGAESVSSLKVKDYTRNPPALALIGAFISSLFNGCNIHGVARSLLSRALPTEFCRVSIAEHQSFI